MTGFTHTLRTECAAQWRASCQHRFVDELFAGTISDAHLRHYLVQDYQFIDRFVALLGAAIASADQYAARVALSQFAAMITSAENTYFVRSFDALGVPQSERDAPALSDATKSFQALMHEAADSRVYANALALLYVAEGLYLDWADQPDRALPSRFEHAEWVHLHANDGFRQFVAWLRSELDRVHAQLSEAERQQVRDFFHRAIRCELAFFDSVYLID